PAETETVEHARAEVFHQHVGLLEQFDEGGLALFALHVHGDRTLVAVQHREVEAVDIGDVAQLGTGDVAGGGLELDNVGAHPCQHLGCGGASLNVGHVENAHACKRFTHTSFLKKSSLMSKCAPGKEAHTSNYVISVTGGVTRKETTQRR